MWHGLWEEFHVTMPSCAHGIVLHQESSFQIVLHLNMPKINRPVSDSWRLNQPWLLSLVELEFLLGSPRSDIAGHGVCRGLPYQACVTIPRLFSSWVSGIKLRSSYLPHKQLLTKLPSQVHFIKPLLPCMQLSVLGIGQWLRQRSSYVGGFEF